MFDRPSTSIGLLFVAGLIGGYLAFLIRAPMPFLIGGVIGSAVFVSFYERKGRRLGKLNKTIRLIAIGTAGAMIGSRVSPDILTVLPKFWPSALAIIPFILMAHGGGYFILRKLGRYPVADAYYGSLPGGLVEAVLLGEKAGARLSVLTVQHFIRVISIVIAVPMLIFLTTGQVVGSASGSATEAIHWTTYDIVLIFLVAIAGMWLGRVIRMPAAHLLGPLSLAVVLSVAGAVDIAVPSWLLHTAQYVIGVTLGAQFSGIDRATLQKGLRLGLLAVAYMLTVGYGFAVFLSPYVPVGEQALFISFAAGGLAEMSLIALSLDLSPVVVALHHLARIFLSLWIGQKIYQRVLAPSKQD